LSSLTITGDIRMNAPKVTANDRLSFTVFVAIAMHVLLIMWQFLPEDPTPAPRTLEITLSHFDDVKKPEHADFLAQSNQLGSGTLDKKAKITSPVIAKEHNIIEQQAFSPPKQSEALKQKKKPVVVSASPAKHRVSLFDKAVKSTKPVTVQARKSMLERSIEIAQLEANLDKQRQNYAKRPRVTRLTAVSTMKAVDSEYVSHVVRKIERTGSLNFPKSAGNRLFGSPRMSIEIYSDGSLRDIKVLQSSGDLVLDSETINIIRLSAPFAPFPKNVRKERDVLELIRTFAYSRKGVSSY